MKRINLMDASWLALDSEATPMQVASLQIFSLPEDAPDTFLRDEISLLKEGADAVQPWNQKLSKPSFLGRLLAPSWIIDTKVDLNYHVRHSALPRPGGERELGILVSRLHSNRLDFRRPLWECHIIEGLEHRRFAIYMKVHHSLMDGVSGIKISQRLLSTDVNEKISRGPWTIGSNHHSPKSEHLKPSVSSQSQLDHVLEIIKEQTSGTPQMVGALAKLVGSAFNEQSELLPLFAGPKSILNTRVQPARRFATQQYPLEVIKELAVSYDATINDIVLYLCSTAIRRYLIENNALPDQSLTVGVPVSIRPAGDEGVGNAISFMIASLATDIGNPLKRLNAIKHSSKVAKEHLQSLPKQVLNQYTALMMSPYVLQQLAGLGGRMRPAYNVLVSNVPGADQPLYFNGAKLEAVYPVSLLTNGGALNITCLSYNGSLNFGYTGCRESLPKMQNIAVFSRDALKELEALKEQL